MALKDMIKKFRLPAVALPLLPKRAQLGLSIAIGGLALVSLLCGIYLWSSGASETTDAFEHGRRLLIHLDNGTIEGKQAAPEAPKPVAATPPAPAPTTETPGETE